MPAKKAASVDSETAYAKINLALHIRRRRADGYHDIETIFAFVDNGDVVQAEAADTLELAITGEFAGGLDGGADNLVMQAAEAMQARYGITGGAKLVLDKRLPVAAGIGGGSADAAATARLLNRLWSIGAPLAELAALLEPLGADIPACIFSHTARGEGTGTSLEAIEGSDVSGMPILLANPREPLATGAVFEGWDGVDGGPLAGATVLEMARGGRNDLQKPAMQICPSISDVLAAIERQKPLLARMSGSGATCFALFESDDDVAAARKEIAQSHRQYWMMTGRLR